MIYPVQPLHARRALRRLHAPVASTTRTRRCRQLAEQYQVDQYGQPVFRNGHMMPFGVSFVQETTVFREYGPVAGNTFKVVVRRLAGVQRQLAVAPDARRRRAPLQAARRQRRARACASRASRAGAATRTSSTSAATPRCAATSTSSSSASKAFFANAELRFPLIEAMLTPIGVLGGLRGVFFANIGGARLQRPAVHAHDDRTTEIYTPLLGYRSSTSSATSRRSTDRRSSSTASGSSTAARRTASASRASLLGFPMHFDWSWKTLFNRDWEDALFRRLRPAARAAQFRKVKFSFWIGYDF